MPDPSELFTNVYVKGLGTEVKLFLSYVFLLGRFNNYRTQGSLDSRIMC